MRLFPIRLLAGCSLAAALAVIVTASDARAFSIVTPEGSSQGSASQGGAQYGVPQFDLEEQTRQFRSQGGAGSAGAAIREFETPFGKGTMQFGVSRDRHMFGSPLGFGGLNSFQAQQNRLHMDRMLAPPGLQHQYR